MNIDWIRVGTFLVACMTGFMTALYYGSAFHLDGSVIASLLTVFSILFGFQLVLFPTIMSVKYNDIKKVSIRNEIVKQIKRKFMRQYILMAIYMLVIVGFIFSIVLKNNDIAEIVRHFTLSIGFFALIMSIEIPRLVWQLFVET